MSCSTRIRRCETRSSRSTLRFSIDAGRWYNTGDARALVGAIERPSSRPRPSCSSRAARTLGARRNPAPQPVSMATRVLAAVRRPSNATSARSAGVVASVYVARSRRCARAGAAAPSAQRAPRERAPVAAVTAARAESAQPRRPAPNGSRVGDRGHGAPGRGDDLRDRVGRRPRRLSFHGSGGTLFGIYV